MVQKIALWNGSLTLKQNQKNLRTFGVSYPNMQLLAESYGLDYVREHVGRRAGPLYKQVDRALKMRESGLTLEEIGKVYNVSRQRVDQVLKKHKLKGEKNEK